MTTRTTPRKEPKPLSRQHRTCIALYALDSHFQARAEVLAANDVTEEDLLEFEEGWLNLRCRLIALMR
jgi:hypothetical protein